MAIARTSNHIEFERRPFIGFGSPGMADPEVRFVFWYQSNPPPDWQVEDRTVRFDIPNGGAKYQGLGGGDEIYTLETGLWFRSEVEWQLFLSARRSVGTLRMNRDRTKHLPDAVVIRFGHRYADFENVIVRSITNQHFDNDGGVRCEVTFERTAGAASYYGAAYYGEPEE